MQLNQNFQINNYESKYQESIKEKEVFWANIALRLNWIEKFTKIKNVNFGSVENPNDVNIKWFEDGILNVCENCVDRHLKDNANKTALIFERDEPGQSEKITFTKLHENIVRFAAILKKNGVKKSDRVMIYMPLIPDAIYAMLACARIGAVHSVIFAGFSPRAIADRITDCQSSFIITSDYSYRAGKRLNLWENINDAISLLDLKIHENLKILSIHNKNDNFTKDANILEENKNFISFENELQNLNTNDIENGLKIEPMNAEDPLFILYTSGSTGKPKGVLHTTGGYLVYASFTHEEVFNIKKDDIYWCTADIGWITGHSYVVYGPLCNATTTLISEGVPQYPNWSRWYDIIDTHKVSVFYTAPTAIRSLMAQDQDNITNSSRKSLRVLGTVGEPINPEVWQWYSKNIGNNICPVIDTWWQTETGGHLITPIAGKTKLKPGSATLPFYGVEPVLLDNESIESNKEGALCFKDSWPGQMRTVYNDHQRFIDTYFKSFPGFYFSGDGARKDEEGYYYITGRMDDVLNVSGHRLGTAEIESALILHDNIVEAAVVGYPHEIKGEAICAYIVLKNKDDKNKDILIKEAKNIVRSEISPIAVPNKLYIVPDLPKTRSGKIMRRILRKITLGENKDFGDTNTLLNPEIVNSIVEIVNNNQGDNLA